MRIPVLSFALILTSISFLFAAEAPVEGTLTLSNKAYELKHVVAYSMKYLGEPATAVLASPSPLNPESIKQVLKEHDGKDEELSLRQPHVKLVFDKKGKFRSYIAYAAGFTTNTGGSDVKAEFKLDGNNVVGQAMLPSSGEEKLQKAFDFKFAVGLLGSASESAPQPAALLKPGVSGTFKGNGKNAALAFVSARRIEPFSDKPSLQLIFTEKDHTRDPKAYIKAGFGDYGSALLISCHENGDIFGCEVAHAAHGQMPFSSSGSMSTGEFQIAGGQVQGKLSSSGQQETFGKTWEVELTFAAPFAEGATAPGKTAETKPAPSPMPAEPTVPAKPEKPAVPAAAGLKASELALPEGAANVEFKALVKHISFQHKADVKTLAADVTAKLATQGWAADGPDLVTPASAILRRKRGAATLTIMIKHATAGSEVKMFTTGLEFDK